MTIERVQKILAKVGVASRRQSEELISEGLVTINGKVAKLGDKAELGKDAIKVKGKLLKSPAEPVYFAFHKPRAVLSTLSDPGNRPTLADYLKRTRARVFPVGRLDFNSEGLILLTNDGDLAEKIQKDPNISRVYQVKVKGTVAPDVLENILKGARVDRRSVKPVSAKVVQSLTTNTVIELIIKGAGSADVKTFLESKRLLVIRMVRTGIGHLSLKGLEPGEHKMLKKSQVEALFQYHLAKVD